MSGPKIFRNGDVVSSALAMDMSPKVDKGLRQAYRLDLGQIVAIHQIDSPGAKLGDKSLTMTTFDVKIISQGGQTEIIPRCRMLQPTFGGGLNNFLEVLPTSPGFQAQDASVARELKRGHMVLIGYVAGHKDSGVILGTMPHQSPVAVEKRPKGEKGTYLEGEIQGLNFIVDNEGALKIIFNGPRNDEGALIHQNGPTTIEVNKEGILNISTNKNQKVTIDRVSGHIRVDNGETYIDMDQEGNKIDVVAKNVNVGTGPLQPQVVGDDWKKIMEELITEIMAIYVPTGVGPSGTPVNSPKFAALKNKLKNALSTKHKVEK